MDLGVCGGEYYLKSKYGCAWSGSKFAYAHRPWLGSLPCTKRSGQAMTFIYNDSKSWWLNGPEMHFLFSSGLNRLIALFCCTVHNAFTFLPLLYTYVPYIFCCCIVKLESLIFVLLLCCTLYCGSRISQLGSFKCGRKPRAFPFR